MGHHCRARRRASQPTAARAGGGLTLALMLLGFGSCQAVPVDHGVPARFERDLTRLVRSLDLRDLLVDNVRRLGRSRETAAILLGLPDAGATQLTRSVRGALVSGYERWAVAPARIAEGVAGTVDGARRSLVRLSPDQIAVRTGTDALSLVRGVRKATGRVGDVLDLRRQAFPSETDRNRQTTAVPAARRESWLERLLRRLSL